MTRPPVPPARIAAPAVVPPHAGSGPLTPAPLRLARARMALEQLAIWKRALGLGKDKEQARLRAMQLFAGADLRRKKDHGRAEALLLAWYGWQTVGQSGA